MLTYFNYFSQSKLILPQMPRFYSIFLIFICSCIKAQNGITDNPEWFIKPVINYGFILEHRSTLGHLVKGYPVMYELDFGKPTLGDKIWHCENNTPDVGFSFIVLDYKNPKQLGYSFSLAPFADIPLNKKNKRSRVIMRLSWGVAYLDKSFDVKTNPKNIAIGSHFNSFVQFKWFWHLQINKNLRFEPGFAFSHARNARTSVPNLGLNLVSLNAGLNYIIPSSKKLPVDKIDSACKVKSKNEILVYAAAGYNQREVASDFYYCGLLSAEYHRNLRNTHKFGFGVDVFVDQNYLQDQLVEFKESAKGMDNFRIAAKICYSYNVGRVSFPIDVGYYVHQKISPDGNIVSRIGMKYYHPNGFVGSIGLRTHFAVAYDFEYGIGYRFNLK